MSPSGKLEGFLNPRISITEDTSNSSVDTLTADSVSKQESLSLNKENNRNVSNLVVEFDKMHFQEEQLLNISDSVLDIIDE